MHKWLQARDFDESRIQHATRDENKHALACIAYSCFVCLFVCWFVCLNYVASRGREIRQKPIVVNEKHEFQLMLRTQLDMFSYFFRSFALILCDVHNSGHYRVTWELDEAPVPEKNVKKNGVVKLPKIDSVKVI